MYTTLVRTIILSICVLQLGLHVTAWADDQPVAGQGGEPSYDQAVYQNQAQVDRAKNVSETYYTAELQRLEDQYAAEKAKGGAADPEVLAELDQKIADWYADGPEISAAQVETMRASGMGWGEIAHELGLHPSVLGLGHAKKAGTLDDVAMATMVDMKSGYGAGHGKSADAPGDKGGEGKGNAGNGQDKDKGGQGGKGDGNGGKGGGNKNK